jgi:hypothetical protein
VRLFPLSQQAGRPRPAFPGCGDVRLQALDLRAKRLHSALAANRVVGGQYECDAGESDAQAARDRRAPPCYGFCRGLGDGLGVAGIAPRGRIAS